MPANGRWVLTWRLKGHNEGLLLAFLLDITPWADIYT